MGKYRNNNHKTERPPINQWLVYRDDVLRKLTIQCVVQTSALPGVHHGRCLEPPQALHWGTPFCSVRLSRFWHCCYRHAFGSRSSSTDVLFGFMCLLMLCVLCCVVLCACVCARTVGTQFTPRKELFPACRRNGMTAAFEAPGPVHRLFFVKRRGYKAVCWVCSLTIAVTFSKPSRPRR